MKKQSKALAVGATVLIGGAIVLYFILPMLIGGALRLLVLAALGFAAFKLFRNVAK